MEFIPAGEIIGDAHQVRTVTISQNPKLPDGEYSFIDAYCSNPKCDCRKTMIQVFHKDKLVSIINFGWESVSYYKKWMNIREDDNLMSEMHGASIDITSPDLVSADEMLALFNVLLNDIWIAKIKRHYSEVKTAISNKPKRP